jgi:hypothetical protein
MVARHAATRKRPGVKNLADRIATAGLRAPRLQYQLACRCDGATFLARQAGPGPRI